MPGVLRPNLFYLTIRRIPVENVFLCIKANIMVPFNFHNQLERPTVFLEPAFAHQGSHAGHKWQLTLQENGLNNALNRPGN